MKSVRWLQNGPAHGYAYFAGNVCQLSDAAAIALEKKAVVIIIPETEEVLPPKTTPDGPPKHIVTNIHKR